MPINQFVEKDDNNADRYREYRQKVQTQEIDQDLRAFFNAPNKFPKLPPSVSGVPKVNNQQPPEYPTDLEARDDLQSSLFARFVEDVSTGFINSPFQLAGGVVDALNETAQFAEDVAPDAGPFDFALNIFDKKGELDIRFIGTEELAQARAAGEFSIVQFPTTQAPESITGSLVRSSAQFITGFLFARRPVAALKGIVPGGKQVSEFVDQALKNKTAFQKKLARGLGTAIEAEVAGAAATMVVFDPHEDRLSTFLETVPGLSGIVPDYLADNNPDNETQWEGRMKNAIEGAALGLFTESLFSIFRAYKGQRMNPDLPPDESINVKGDPATSAEPAPVDIPEPVARPEGEAGEKTLPIEERIKEIIEEEEVPTIPDDLAESLSTTKTDDVFLEGDKVPKRIRDQMELFPETQRAKQEAEVLPALPKTKVTGSLNLRRVKAKMAIARNLASTSSDLGNTKPRQAINVRMLDPNDPIGDLMRKKVIANKPLIRALKGGDKQTIKEWENGAKDRLQQLENYLGRPVSFNDPEEVLAAGDVLVSANQILTDRLQIADSPYATQADLARAGEMEDFYNLMISHFEASASKEGRIFRALQETRKKLRNERELKQTSRGRQQDIEDTLARLGGTRAAKERFRALLDAQKMPTAMNEMVRKLNTPGKIDAIYEIWVNSILSGPHTHFRNIASNSSVSVLSIAETAWNAAISKVFFDSEISFAEVSARALGLKEGIRDGMRLVAHGSQAEDVGHLNIEFDKQLQIEMVHPNAMSSKTFDADPNTRMGEGLDMMGKFLNVPTNLLNTEDKFFKAIGYRMELKAIAIRKATSEGLNGPALDMRAQQLETNVPEWLHMEALDNAHYQTFTKRLGHLGQRAVDSVRNVPGGRFVLPFIRTPTNILKYSFERTPLVAFSKSFQDDIAAGGAQAAQAWGRMSMGSMIMMSVAAMTMEGIITGPGPNDKRMARALRGTGWRPHSVKIGDKFIPFDRFDPVGNTFAWGAEIGEVINNLSDEDANFVVSNAVVAFSQNLLSQRYLRGIFDAMGAIDPSNPMKTPQGWLQRFLPSAIPYSSFLRSVARQIDPNVRVRRTAFGDPDLIPGIDPDIAVYMDDLISGFRATIPGMSGGLPLDRDQDGKEIENPKHLFTGLDFLAPNWASIDKTDKINTIIRENKIGFSRVPRKINGVALTGHEYSEYQRISGEFYADRVAQLVNSTGFDSLTGGPDGMKALQIQAMIRKSRKFGRQQMLNLFPELKNRILSRQNIEREQLRGPLEKDFSVGRAAFPTQPNDTSGSSLVDQLGGI